MNIRFRVREAFQTNLELQTENKPWKVSIQAPLPDWSRRMAVASFRTATGHDCLGRHLHRLGILPTPQCILCNTTDDMAADHIRLCPSLSSSNFVERYGRPGKRWSTFNNVLVVVVVFSRHCRLMTTVKCHSIKINILESACLLAQMVACLPLVQQVRRVRSLAG